MGVDPANAAVTDQQFAINEIVAKHLVVGQEPVEFTRVRGLSSQKANPNGCIDKDHLCTAALTRRLFPAPRHVAHAGFGAPQRAKTLISRMADQRLQSHLYGFRIGGGPAHGTSLPQEIFIDMESLLHTDDVAIRGQPKQPAG
jgi:hypothetical protein